MRQKLRRRSGSEKKNSRNWAKLLQLKKRLSRREAKMRSQYSMCRNFRSLK